MTLNNDVLVKMEFSGIVQGRGVRPKIHNIAQRNKVTGFVRNIGSSIEIEAISFLDNLVHFKNEVIEFLGTLGEFKLEKENYYHDFDSSMYDSKFQIIPSSNKVEISLSITIDLFPCSDCLSKFYDTSSEFNNFPFIACINCGPRYSILEKFPYDRNNTADKDFPRCKKCEKKFHNIKSKYHYDMAFSCRKCGPKYTWRDLKSDIQIDGFDEIIEKVSKSVLNNEVIGIKGTGLYHIIGLANKDVEKKIREIKMRPYKPFAYMVANISNVQVLCNISKYDIKILNSQNRPIMVFPLNQSEFDSSNGFVGVSLPTNLFYQQLLRKLENDLITKFKSGYNYFPGIIYTSMNIEYSSPITELISAIEFCNKNQINKLCTYNRDIVQSIEDTVLQADKSNPIMIRPGRGYYPKTFKIPDWLKPVKTAKILALGSHKYCSFALSNGSEIILSQAYGSQKNWENVKYFIKSIIQQLELFKISPEIVVYDVHPNQYAQDIIQELEKFYQFKTFKVDHHHAHFCSTIIENNINSKAIGVIFDGLGADKDNNLRGADFLFGDLNNTDRLASIEEFQLPGGDICEKEIFRTALSLANQYSYLNHSELEIFFQSKGIEIKKIKAILKMLSNNINTYKISSMGRIFDAVAFLSGISKENRYQAESPLKLMRFYKEKVPLHIVPYGFSSYYPNIRSKKIELIRPDILINQIISDVRNNVSKELISTRFHLAIVNMIVSQIQKYFQFNKEYPVIFSGGVFQNYILRDLLKENLDKFGYKNFWNELTSPGDYSIPLGQVGYLLSKLTL